MRNLGLLVLSFALIGCGLEQQPGFQCPADKWLPELEQIEVNPYKVQACPAGAPLHYTGKGCVPCTYYDQCGAAYLVGGCVPEPGVFCFDGLDVCPAGYEMSQDNTVKRGE